MTTSAFPLDGLQSVQGAPPKLKQGPFVLELFATWCGPCRTSIPHLNQLAKRFQGKIAFVGISSEDESAVKSFVSKMGEQMRYPVAIDPNGRVSNSYSRAFGVRGIPHAFLVNESGTIVFQGHPMDPKFTKALEDVAATVVKKTRQEERKDEVELKGSSKEELSGMTAHHLKAALQQRGVDVSRLLEKSEYVDECLKFA